MPKTIKSAVESEAAKPTKPTAATKAKKSADRPTPASTTAAGAPWSQSTDTANIAEKANEARIATSEPPPTKSSAVLKMLRSASGATIADIMTATNWQAHSVRGFLSGTVKKKLGLQLQKTAGDGDIQRYRIVEPALEPRRSERRRAGGTSTDSAEPAGVTA